MAMRIESRSLLAGSGRWIVGIVIALWLVLMRPVSVTRTALADDAPPAPADYASLDMDDVEHLLAPIALYPDALLAQVLAASTYPDDVTAAAHWEDAGNAPQNIDGQSWDSSVKGVGRYPAILHYLASNADWMNQLGGAFLNQRADVMTAVQNLRNEAVAAGTLRSTPQQTVVNEDGYIQIIPTNPDILYAPVYDPTVIYDPPPPEVGQPYVDYITFGPGVDVGAWLDFDLDWYDHGIYHGNWGHDRPWWHEHDWNHGGPAPHYLDDRPGIYKPGQFKDRDGHPVNVAADHWARDSRKPLPRPVNHPPARPDAGREIRGYPAPAHANQPAPAPRPSEVSRASERGRGSRQSAPPPAPRAPVAAPRAPAAAPVREAPARAEPRQSSPPPEARPSAPVRGGAMGGYQSGAAASGSSGRGAASRGGGGGGRR